MVWTACTLFVFVAVTVCLSFSNYFERRHYIYAAILTATLSIFFWLTKTIIESEENYATIGIYWGSLIVAAGWIITNEVAINNSRKQHTVNLITAYFTNAQLVEDRKTIQKTFPSYSNKFTKDFDFEGREDLHKAVNRELNYYEFLAAALYRRDLDETLLKDCLGQMVINIYEQMEDYINFWRRQNIYWWSYLAQLHSRWTEPEDSITSFFYSLPSPPAPPPHPTPVPAR